LQSGYFKPVSFIYRQQYRIHLLAINSVVDETETVSTARFKDSFESSADITIDIGAVDQAIVQRNRTGGLRSVPQFEYRCVIPVLKEHDAKILIVVGGSWTVDDDPTEESISVL
jgi:hypothetical protein